MYVNYEYSYDTFDGSENIQRVYMDYTEEGVFVPGDAQTYNLSGPALKVAFPEIKEFTRLAHITNVTFKHGNKLINGEKGAIADPSYFTVFKYPLLKGDYNSVLKDPYTIVLTESLSKKIFGNLNPIGKTVQIYYGGEKAFTVNGVLEDLPKNTHMKNDFLISFNTALTWEGYRDNPEPNWNGNNLFTYIKLDENTDIVLLKKKIMAFKVEALPFERHNIEALEDIHLYSDKPYEAEANGSISRVRFLLAIALIIIILSWLNYVNLSTAKSLERLKETGIRKVAGAKKVQIILQSLIESSLLNLVALIIATVIILITLPVFNNYIGKELIVDFSSIIDFMPMIGFILFGALVSGLYPAFVLSNFTTANALKGKVTRSHSGLTLRKGLIMGQFLATIILLIGTITVTKQIDFLQNQPIGANLNQVLAVNGVIMGYKSDSILRNEIEVLKDEIKNLSYVKSTVLAQTYPGGEYDNLSSNVGITFPNGIRDETRIWYNYTVGPEFFKLMNMEFVAGNSFIENSKGYSNQIVLNERFVKYMGISKMENAIGKTVKFFEEDWIISGVIKDYHHFGLKTSIEPMILRYSRNVNNILIKIDQNAVSTAGMNAVISQIENKWKERFPESTFNYTFLDQKFEAQYKEDRAFGSAFQIFAILAIFIASMGLFGLTSYTVVQRKKEIGIRKVNGASIGQVLILLNKDFVKWIGLAFVIAVPISWFIMNQWLIDFAYKTTMSWWIYVLAGVIALTIALLTISWQTYSAARANPVKSLRTE
tara:strand:+ start:207 stop:2510 length:2304 start_codon:yes stop_codon:yes gene_type:complete